MRPLPAEVVALIPNQKDPIRARQLLGYLLLAAQDDRRRQTITEAAAALDRWFQQANQFAAPLEAQR